MMFVESAIRRKYSRIPKSLKNVFSRKGDLYFNGLEESVFRRKKTITGRYEDIASIVFGFIEHVYRFKENMTLGEKLALIKGETPYFRNLLAKSIDRISKNIKPCSCKKISSTYADRYDAVLNFMDKDTASSLWFITDHFKQKMLSGKHPFMSRDLHDIFFSVSKGGYADSMFVFIESVIHGIDDYIDSKDADKKEAVADVLNIICGLNAIVHVLLKTLKPNLKDILCMMTGKKPRMERAIDMLLFSVTELSNVPLVEKETKKIMENGSDEFSLARLNMETRAAGIMIFLRMFGFCNSFGKDFDDVTEMVKINRIMQLLAKDILDIKDDLKNRDYTPVAIWSKKYRKGLFRKKVENLANYYVEQAKKCMCGRNFKDAKTVCMKKIENNFLLLRSRLSSHRPLS